MPNPILGVSVLVRRGDSVLLVKRGKAPSKGAWALPGGKVAPGERLAEAAAREVREETGVAVSRLRQIDLAEIIDRDGRGGVTIHHVVIVFAGTAEVADTVVAGDDAVEARWLTLGDASGLPLTVDTARILAAESAARTDDPR